MLQGRFSCIPTPAQVRQSTPGRGSEVTSCLYGLSSVHDKASIAPLRLLSSALFSATAAEVMQRSASPPLHPPALSPVFSFSRKLNNRLLSISHLLRLLRESSQDQSVQFKSGNLATNTISRSAGFLLLKLLRDQIRVEAGRRNRFSQMKHDSEQIKHTPL